MWRCGLGPLLSDSESRVPTLEITGPGGSVQGNPGLASFFWSGMRLRIYSLVSGLGSFGFLMPETSKLFQILCPVCESLLSSEACRCLTVASSWLGSASTQADLDYGTIGLRPLIKRSSRPSEQQIWESGLRTLELCLVGVL